MLKLLTAAVLLAGTATTALGASGAAPPPDRMAEFGPAKVQPGYVQFCNDYYEGECGPFPMGTGRPEMTAEMRIELKEVNTSVNRHVKPATDQELWGVEDHWSYPVSTETGLRGDCEDYVLEKRRLLMEMGWPAHSLLITVVLDRDNSGHAVLTVATDDGDLVLDNMEPRILYWHETQYRFVKRQSEQDPNMWASLRRGTTAPQEVPVAGSE